MKKPATALATVAAPEAPTTLRPKRLPLYLPLPIARGKRCAPPPPPPDIRTAPLHESWLE